MRRGLILAILVLGLGACGGADKPTVVADVGGELGAGQDRLPYQPADTVGDAL